MSFEAADTRLFFSRNDPTDLRLGDLVKALPATRTPEDFSDTFKEIAETSDATTRNFAIAGYPDDEGIRINGGRPGASQAPTEIRRVLYKMTPALMATHEWKPALWDAGDLRLSGETLEERHKSVTRSARAALENGLAWIALGGGHDYGFADAAAFCDWCLTTAKCKPLVINFDAHLDVRPVARGISSGTPFFRMLEAYPNCDFVEVGIQGHCNSRDHLAWARERGARVLTQEERQGSGESMVAGLSRLMGDWLLRPRPVFLSVDIDGFSSAIAPGCSQSWATGFEASEFFACLDLLTNRLDIKMLGIYEVSPPLDTDSRTSKLAAQIIHRVLS
jgi:formiminoglutamase